MKRRARRRAISVLRQQIGEPRIVRARRGFDSDVAGFVLGVGKRWALLARTSDGGFFNGLVAIRLRDIVTVTLDKSFETRFALARPEWPVDIPQRIDLDSVSGVLWFFAERFPILGFRQERTSDALWIGELDGMDDKDLMIREITPQAEWWDHSRWFRKKLITTVEGGDAYQVALWTVLNEEINEEK